ncbi:MAG: DUF4179 domain-containing protein [Clostridium sp.]|mgnify:FL=1
MRSNEERVVEVKRRIAEKERQKKLRRSRIAAVSAVAACLVLILVLSLFMPGIAGQLRPGGYSDYEMVASMFGENGALGYIIIGLLAFLLGVCVTILCFRIRLLNREEQSMEDKKEDREDGADQ